MINYNLVDIFTFDITFVNCLGNIDHRVMGCGHCLVHNIIFCLRVCASEECVVYTHNANIAASPVLFMFRMQLAVFLLQLHSESKSPCVSNIVYLAVLQVTVCVACNCSMCTAKYSSVSSF